MFLILKRLRIIYKKELFLLLVIGCPVALIKIVVVLITGDSYSGSTNGGRNNSGSGNNESTDSGSKNDSGSKGWDAVSQWDFNDSVGNNFGKK
jgi:hypothetical protein